MRPPHLLKKMKRKTSIKQRQRQRQRLTLHYNLKNLCKFPSKVNHQLGDKVAYLIIPKIQKKYSIYWGADDKVLKRV